MNFCHVYHVFHACLWISLEVCVRVSISTLPFWKECIGVIVFWAHTRFINRSYLFQSHYCNARFVPKMGFLYIGGTGILTVRDTALKLSSSDTTVTEYLPRGVQKRRGWCGVGLSRKKTRIREMGYVKMSFCEKCADGATMEKEIEIAAKTWWWPIQNLGAADALHVRRRRLRGYGGNFDNYNLATTCPNLRMAKLIRVGAPGARSTNQAEYSGMKQEQGMAAFWP